MAGEQGTDATVDGEPVMITSEESPDTDSAAAATDPESDAQQDHDPGENLRAAEGTEGMDRYLAASEDISVYLEQVAEQLGPHGVPPKIRLLVWRTYPQDYAGYCGAYPLEIDQPPDLEQIAQDHGGGLYMLRVQNGGRFEENGTWKNIAFNGPVKTTPGHGPQQPQQIPQPQVQDNSAMQQVIESVGRLTEQVGALAHNVVQEVAQVRTEMEEAKRNPPNPWDELGKMSKGIKAAIEFVDTVRPPPPEPPAAPIQTAAATEGAAGTGATIAQINSLIDRIPQVLQTFAAVAQVIPDGPKLEPVAELPGVRQVEASSTSGGGAAKASKPKPRGKKKRTR